jgi:serine/threonine-protein kinase
MSFEIGQALGNYDILDVLDATVSGVTYKVRNQLDGRTEALKILPAELREDRERVERFLREANIHARLEHPNIAAFYSAMEIEGELIMTMELVQGLTLEQRLMQGPIPFEQGINYGLQALAGLEHAHSNNVVHRNISPSSIVVTPSGKVKIIEFGLAKAMTDPRLTLTGMVIGPMYYLSPEQVKGVPTLDARTDIYSLGMVLYEVLTGKKPFDSRNPFDVMEAQVRTMPDAPSAVRQGLPQSLDGVILTAIAKEPADRHKSAAAFREQLERAMVAPAMAANGPACAPDLTSEVSAARPPEAADALASSLAEIPPLGQVNEDEFLGIGFDIEEEENEAVPAAAATPLPRPGPRRTGQTTLPPTAALAPAARRNRAPQRVPKESRGIEPFMVGAVTFAATTVILFFFYILTH